MQISFIGAGKVGVSLGKYFISKGRKVGGYYSLSPKSAAWQILQTQSNIKVSKKSLAAAT